MISSRFLRSVAIFGLMTVLTTSAVMAQEGGDRPRGDREGGGRGFGFGGGGGFGGPGGMMRAPQIDRATLLRADKIRQELKIEEAQAVTIDAALDAYREERESSPRPDREAFEKMSEEERMAYFTKMQKEREELSKKTDEILIALLDEAQAKRLAEISIQVRMAMSATGTLKAEDIRSKLTISEEQVSKLDEVEKAAGAEMQKMFEEMRNNGPGGGGGGFEAMRTKMEEMRKKSTESAMVVLTDEQKTALDGLKGAAFEFNPRELMGRGPGGPGAPGQGGGGRGRGGRPPAE